MKTPDLFRLIQPLLTQASFTAAEAKKLGMTSANLAYYIKKGHVKRLRRGIYQGASFRYPEEHFRWEDLIEAANSTPNGVVCLISALALYDITDQIPREHWIAVPHSASVKKRTLIRILRFRNMELGKTTFNLGGIKLPIFDLERTIIDSFRLLSIEIAIKALKMGLAKKGEGRLDLRKLQEYSKILRYNITPYLMTATT